MKEYNITKLKNDIDKSKFTDTFKKVFTKSLIELSESEKIKILELALMLINSDDQILFDLGYFIIVLYSVDTNDYEPLFEISDNLLNFPVLKFLIDKGLVKIDDSVFNEINSIVIDVNKAAENYYYTAKQKKMNYSFFKNDCDMMVVAPTSFGKTDLIKKYVKDNYKNKVICILEPTKAMLNQVRNDLLKEFNGSESPKIITHHDMNFEDSEKVVFVMTQERLFKLIYDRKINFNIDSLLVDEAHNIFEKNSRAFLLAKLIYLLRNKNKNLIVKYFSPIIQDASNLKIKKDIDVEIEQLKINPKMKVKKYYFADFFKKKKFVYNQYFNEFYSIGELENIDKYEFIIEESSNKNLIYLNRPKDIKAELPKLAKFLPDNNDDNIIKICKNLSDYINKDYDLIDYIKKGIVYHFGVMPDNIRNYIEKCVKEEESLKYIYCTSTLLEGVNMPFDKLFILDLKKGLSNLTYHQLENLIGRINRYKNIFDLKNEDLSSLISKVYFIKEKKEKSAFEEFIRDNLKAKSNSKKRLDDVKNVMLCNSEESLSKAEESELENLKEEPIEKECLKIKTKIGRTLLELNINDFSVFENEEIIEKRIDDRIVAKDDSIVDKIYKLFINEIDIVSDNKDNLKRLENESARRFYNMIISWRKENLSINESVNRLSYYWNNLSEEQKNYVYVGRAFGEIKRHDTDIIPLYVNLNEKTSKEIINLAIIRVKEENDYIDYNLFKYIDFLYKFDLIDKRDYYLLHYGTDNEMQIYFQRDGLSRDLSKLLVGKYSEFVKIVINGFYIDKEILKYFDENEVLKYELECYFNV